MSWNQTCTEALSTSDPLTLKKNFKKKPNKLSSEVKSVIVDELLKDEESKGHSK